MAEESALILRAKTGDLPALEQLFALHGPALFRLARAILGSPDDAEDALQEVIVRVLRRPGRLDPARALRPYLWRIMTNECLSRLRRHKREAAALAEQAAQQASAGHCSPAAPTVQDVRLALATLAPRQRVAITLVGFDGLDLQSASRAMGCSVGALKSHLHRARGKLKARLDEHLPSERREP
jgi:RNA polymerase sigma-70 factor, ECF subfamily